MARTEKIIDQITELKRLKDAIILAHNYQIPEVQDIADYVGDSLGLSIRAQESQANIIVFCGVLFMAETASILCPNQTVLLPEPSAGCPLANMISESEVLNLRKKHPQAAVVCYINSSAEVKAVSDVCCTSANAVQVVNSLKAEEIIFVPDKYLGSYVQTQTDKKIILADGFCPTHQTFIPEKIIALKEKHPGALFLTHPESNPETLALADFIGSTSGMLQFAAQHDGPFIVGTESGLMHRLQQKNPDQLFIHGSANAICPNMKKTTLEKVLWSLQDMQHEIKIEEPLRSQAKQAIDRMLQIK
ncbi:MAG TPA: quinolinate synthase NadA [Candidatus Wirthbacteria bacterium]|nr:quinolinate synthase NadA [Candidatus Wirthbacteria bacterium]